MLEKDIESRFVQGVKSLGGRCYKWVSPGSIGVPDRIVMLPGGRVYFVELKAESGRLSKMQRFQIGQMESTGVRVRVLKGLQQVETFLKEVSLG